MPEALTRAEPSELVRASRSLMSLWEVGFVPPQEIERRALGVQRLRWAFSSIPWHAERAAKGPDYWNDLYASRATW